jgi:Protein of unknown function (DUF3500)/Inositol monophosphatase family
MDVSAGLSFAIDAATVAAGEVDAALLTLGGVWDYAATSLIVHEAGGSFHDAWGGTRLDTTTAPILDLLAMLRPNVADVGQLASTVTTPLRSSSMSTDSADVSLDGWRNFGIRPLPSMSARVHVENAPPFILDIVDERAALLLEPFVGVTTDGTVRVADRSPGVAQISAQMNTREIARAALVYLHALTPEQREKTSFPMHAEEWRMWINVHMNHFRHGLLLEELDVTGRELALAIVAATMSGRGFQHARSIMRVNELLAEMTGDAEAFGEWPYFMSIFGTPSAEPDAEPWGWQIDGHHLCVNAVVFDGRVVMTPTFMGAEPRRVHHGPLAGTSLFDSEESGGLALIRSLDPAMQSRAIIHPSLHPDEIAPHLQNMFDGRMQAGAFHDNLVLPYQGVAGSEMTGEQRRLMLDLTRAYVEWTADVHVPERIREVEAHLNDTWFSWYGGFDDEAPFYFRVHSPVILVEFDHHPGIAFDNDVPTRHHVHTVVRTPNGGDYGTDLLRAHYNRFDHANGAHRPRG